MGTTIAVRAQYVGSVTLEYLPEYRARLVGDALELRASVDG
jgi:hypothetical protein